MCHTHTVNVMPLNAKYSLKVYTQIFQSIGYSNNPYNAGPVFTTTIFLALTVFRQMCSPVAGTIDTFIKYNSIMTYNILKKKNLFVIKKKGHKNKHINLVHLMRFTV